MRMFLTCLLTLFLSAGIAQAEGTFQVIVESSSTTVFDLTPDGTWAAGTDNGQAYRWSEATGLELLSPSEWQWTHTAGISDDGTMMASSVEYGSSDPRVFGPALWTEGSGWTPLDNLYPDPPYDGGGDLSFGSGYDISGDGSTICGLAWHPNYRASGFTWTDDGGIVDLGRPSPDFGSSRASKISADGSTVVGFWEHEVNGSRRPVRWVDGGAEDLFLGADTWGESMGVSSDGSVVVGQVGFEDDPGYGWAIAFVYSDDDGYTDLGIMEGHNPWDGGSNATGVSDNGIVVGYSGNPGPWGVIEPFVWTEADGMMRVTEYLALNEVEIPANIEIYFCNAISADGTTIGGQGLNTDTWSYVAWVARVEPPVYKLKVSITGEVEYNQVNDGLFADVNPGDPVTIEFLVSSDDFIDSETYNVRGYTIDPGSFTQTMGSVTVPLADPFPAGETPRFIMRNNDPASDGFFIESAGIDWPMNGLPLNEPGQIADWFGSRFEVGYSQAIDSLEIMDAVGTYDYTNLTSFYFTVNDSWADPIGLIFTQMEIGVFQSFDVNIDCLTPTLTLPDIGTLDVSVTNNYYERLQVQGTINVVNCYGNTWTNLRRGTTNLSVGETFASQWSMNIPRYNSTCNCDLVWELVATETTTEESYTDTCIISTNCDF
jgi:uncharacterized membrane protein